MSRTDPLGLQSTYFDPNYGDIGSYQNPAALPYVGGMAVLGFGTVTGVGLAYEAPALLAWLGLGTAAADTPEGQAELNEAEQGLTQMGKGIVCNSKVVAHAPIEAVTSHEQLALQSRTLLEAPLANTPGALVDGAEAFTYSMQGQQIYVTGSMNFNSTVSQNTVDVVTFYLKGKQ